MTEKSRHRRADLRAALIEAGVALIAEGGPDALSIRGVAARAQVSHAAPAHHFASLAHLRTAIVAEGYKQFTEAMENEIATVAARDGADDPRQAALAACVGYLRFAHGAPALFQLMHGGAAVLKDDPDFKREATASYEVLRRVCAPLAHGPAGPEGTERLVWSLVHGFATLTISADCGGARVDDPIRAFQKIFPQLPLASEA